MKPLVFSTVHKNGSSWAVVIPKAICRAFDIQRGDQLAVNVRDGGIVEFRKVKHNAKERVIKY